MKREKSRILPAHKRCLRDKLLRNTPIPPVSSLGGINAAGLYTATAGRSGTQTIIAGVSTGLTTLTTLMQYIYAASIAVAPVLDISEGETYNAVVTLLPLLPATANEPLVYSSSNNDIAAFSAGVVVAQGVGTAIITATGQYSGVSGSQTVTVTPAVVEEEYLKIDNKLSEIAANGPRAQASARQNLGIPDGGGGGGINPVIIDES